MASKRITTPCRRFWEYLRHAAVHALRPGQETRAQPQHRPCRAPGNCPIAAACISSLLALAAISCAVTPGSFEASRDQPRISAQAGSGTIPIDRLDNRHSDDAAAASIPRNRALRSASAGLSIVWHSIESFTTNILFRPVSSSRNLALFVTKNSADFIHDTFLDLFGLPHTGAPTVPPIVENTPMDLNEWERTLDRLTGEQSSFGTVSFLIDGNAFFPRFIESIQGAQESVLLRTYIFDNDDFAVAMADLLKQRSKAIRIRIMTDGLGSLSSYLTQSQSMPERYLGPLSMANYLESDSNLQLRVVKNTWFAGDHTKTFIIDNDTAFVGGMNIGREYRYDWHDMMAELKGPIVQRLAAEAERSWAYHGIGGDLTLLRASSQRTPHGDTSEMYPLRVLQTKPYDSQLYRVQLAAMRRSQSYIYLENAYLSDDKILYELIRARLRGVDVRVIMPARGDIGAMDRSNVLAINKLLRYGARVYMYPGMTHVKAAIFDGWACFGSANYDKLSLRVNGELNVATSHPDAVATLIETLFIPDFAKSKEIKRPLPTRITDHLFERVADLLL